MTKKKDIIMEPLFLDPTIRELAREGSILNNFKTVELKPKNWFTRLFWRFIKVETFPKYVRKKE